MRAIFALLPHIPLMGLLFAAETPMSLLYAPALAPDGKSFAFEWDDDIWLASTETGEAKRIIATPGRDMFPRITPDGQRIVFTSDSSGMPQVFSRDRNGGEIIQHTFHTEGSQLECLSPEGNRALIRGLRDRSGYKPWRLMTIDLAKPTRETTLFDAAAHTPSWSPDGTSVLFCRGGELPYRQGFQGSRASRIWSFDLSTGGFNCEVPGESEARSPLWMRDGSGFYFVSNQSGTANLWEKRRGIQARQLTFHTDEGVLTPDLSHDGSTLLYRHGFQLIRIHPHQPGKLETIRVFTKESLADRSKESVAVKGCLHAGFTSDLRQVVFSEAGELWLLPRSGAVPLRLTTTPEAEEEPCFSKDGKRMFFLKDDGLATTVHSARLIDGELVDITKLATSTASMSDLTPSPDGTRIAWIEARGDVRVANVEGGNPRTVFPCWDKPTFDWSPDGHWLAVAAEDRNANRDVHLVPVNADTPSINLTRHPSFDGSPRWSPDGRRLAFTSKRGTPGEASLWCIDFGKSGVPRAPSTAWLHARADAAKPLSTRGIEPRRVIWSHDPDLLYFQSRKSSNRRLYQLDVRDGGMTTLAEQSGIPIGIASNGSMLWKVQRIPQILHQGKSTAFPIDTTLQRSRPDFLRLGFRRIWRTLGERFHDPAMNGHNWQAIRTKYEEHAAAARTSREFDHIIARLMGELNASHLVFQREPWPDEATPRKSGNRTLHTGIRFENPVGKNLRVKSVIPGSPAAKLPDPPQSGESVIRIAGHDVNDSTPLDSLLDGASGMKVPVVLRNPEGAERTLSITCITYAHARKLDEAARHANAAHSSARQSIAYLHLPDMSRDSLERFQLFLHRKTANHQALILDLRDNGGGREANRMLASFQQEIPFHTRPRNGPDGYPFDRLPAVPWPAPVVVLCNQNTYSNSEIFCHAFLAARRGPVVGTTTAGGVISAVMTSIPGLGKLQVPFRTWTLAESGKSLDLNGAHPTHPVDLTPSDENFGLDPQLETAICLLASKPDGTSE